MNMFERYVCKIEGSVIPLDGDDIDTDRIIPARFMKGITFDGLGSFVFYDERFDANGNKKSHPFNDDRYNGNSILLVESNFGCGSSREHAPQALMRHGIRAVVGISFADIFAGNCTQLGIPAVRLTKEQHHTLSVLVKRNPSLSCCVDLEQKHIRTGEVVFPVMLDDASCKALVKGLWDTTSLLLESRQLILEKAASLPYLS